MKKVFCLMLALCLIFSLAACASNGGKETEAKPQQTDAAKTDAAKTEAGQPAAEADADYTIRIYSNSNSTDRVEWFVKEAADAGFKVSIDDNSVISGDAAAVQTANEKKDADVIFGLNETRWGQIVNGQYENLKLLD